MRSCVWSCCRKETFLGLEFCTILLSLRCLTIPLTPPVPMRPTPPVLIYQTLPVLIPQTSVVIPVLSQDNHTVINKALQLALIPSSGSGSAPLILIVQVLSASQNFKMPW